MVWFMKKHVVCCVLQDYRHGVIVKKIKCHSHNYYNKHFLCGKEKFEMRWSNKEVCLKQFAHSNTKNGLLNFLFTIKSSLGNNNRIYFRMRSHFQLFAFDWKIISEVNRQKWITTKSIWGFINYDYFSFNIWCQFL